MSAQELFTSICERIPDALTRHKVPGVVLGITRRDRTECAASLLPTSTTPPVDEGTLFQIGSTTQTFTATAATRLVEQGKLGRGADGTLAWLRWAGRIHARLS